MKLMLCEKGASARAMANGESSRRCSKQECKDCGWTRLNGTRGCPIEHANNISFPTQIIEMAEITVVRKGGEATKKKYQKVSKLMTPYCFMGEFEKVYKLYAERYYCGKWQAYVKRSREELLLKDLGTYAMSFDWMENAELKPSRELQSEQI